MTDKATKLKTLIDELLANDGVVQAAIQELGKTDVAIEIQKHRAKVKKEAEEIMKTEAPASLNKDTKPKANT